MGYNVTGMHVNVGIGEYSARSQEVVEHFSQKHNAPVIIKNTEKEFNFNILDLCDN